MKKILSLAFVALVMLGCRKESEKVYNMDILYQVNVERYDPISKKWLNNINVDNKYTVEISFTNSNNVIETVKSSGKAANQVMASFNGNATNQLRFKYSTNLQGSGDRISAKVYRVTPTDGTGIIYEETTKFNGDITINANAPIL